VHVGDPAEIGIPDVTAVDWGLPPDIGPDDTCMFWGCGVTPQAVAMAARLPFMITHTTGHMFLADLTLEDIAL
jgi:uncharacterized protein YcsI (UPF0317 family)